MFGLRGYGKVWNKMEWNDTSLVLKEVGVPLPTVSPRKNPGGSRLGEEGEGGWVWFQPILFFVKKRSE